MHRLSLLLLLAVIALPLRRRTPRPRPTAISTSSASASTSRPTRPNTKPSTPTTGAPKRSRNSSKTRPQASIAISSRARPRQEGHPPGRHGRLRLAARQGAQKRSRGDLHRLPRLLRRQRGLGRRSRRRQETLGARDQGGTGQAALQRPRPHRNLHVRRIRQPPQERPARAAQRHLPLRLHRQAGNRQPARHGRRRGPLRPGRLQP